LSTDFSAMHADYQKIKPFDFPFTKPFFVWLGNMFFAFDRWRKCRQGNPALDISNHRVTSADGHRFRVIEMTPKGVDGARPTIIYYHGGAFSLSWASMHQLACERYAIESGATLLLVDYRLGPKHVFPAPFEDCYAALEWVHANAEERGYDVTRIATMGDSAGGCFAAGVAQKAVDEGKPVAAQAMIYPVLDSDCKTTSAVEFTDTPIWNANTNRNMWEMYLRNVPAGTDPAYASPGHKTDLAGQPPAYIETAQFDPLRDEGLIYATALEEAGVAVERNETQGTVHGYEMAPQNPAVEVSMQKRCAYLQQAFTS
jgi:acetyl esterase